MNPTTMHRKDSADVMRHKQFAFKVDEATDAGTFKGYASVFGNIDSYKEIVAPGAFSKSLKAIKKSKDPVPVLWQHDSRQPIGGDELMEEDDKGLKADGFLLIDVIPLALQALALMKRRVVKGLSIGYFVNKSKYDEQTGVRTLFELDLQEYSIVTFPANTLANVESVKAAVKEGQLPSLSEFEDFLREAGYSRTHAKAIAGHGLRKLLSQCDADGETKAAMGLLLDFKLPTFNS